jgi:hypothetical protein
MSTQESSPKGLHKPVTVDGMPVFGPATHEMAENGPIESGKRPESGAQTPAEAIGQLTAAVVVTQARQEAYRPPAETRVIPEDGIKPLQSRRPLHNFRDIAY